MYLKELFKKVNCAVIVVIIIFVRTCGAGGLKEFSPFCISKKHMPELLCIQVKRTLFFFLQMLCVDTAGENKKLHMYVFFWWLPATFFSCIYNNPLYLPLLFKNVVLFLSSLTLFLNMIIYYYLESIKKEENLNLSFFPSQKTY